MASRRVRPTLRAEDGEAGSKTSAFDIILSSLGTQPAWKDELTQEVLDQLVAVSKIGGFRRQTALACNVKPEVLKSWLEEGMRADGSRLCQELSVRFQASQAQLSLMLVGTVSSAALRGDWQAAIAMLEKRELEWAGEVKDSDLTPPELSEDQRKQMLVGGLKKPKGALREALIEAGYDVPELEEEEPAAPEDSGSVSEADFDEDS